ncbi:MAG: caspase family protein, partial [Armatimonadota bacterium]|nr:caspase family protein [Armatimonadota bacterium]
VNKYDDTENIPSLRYSVRDVTAVYDILVDPARGGFEKDSVFLLTDDTPDKPTNINIIKYLNRIARRAEPEDMVLVYYSGHGYEENGRGYILPCNTDIEALAASAVDNIDFIDTLDRMKAQRIVTIIDACHSGSIRRTAGTGGLSGQFYSAYGGGKGRVVLASASAGQKAWEDARLGQGVFTQYVKLGLSGEADRNRDGAVVFLELARYVYDNVKRWAQQNGKEQEPMIQAENFAVSDIVLALNPAAVPTGPLAEKKRKVYAKLDPEDADYACALLEKPTRTELEGKIVQYLDQMIEGKITTERYLDFVRTMRPNA